MSIGETMSFNLREAWKSIKARFLSPMPIRTRCRPNDDRRDDDRRHPADRAAQPDASGAPTQRKRLTDWIWHIHGSVPLDPGQSPTRRSTARSAVPHTGTARERNGDTLTFTSATRRRRTGWRCSAAHAVIEAQAEGWSCAIGSDKALLYCFLAPLLFLAFAQATVALGKLESPRSRPRSRRRRKTPAPLNPIDKRSARRHPSNPRRRAGDDDKDKKPSPTAAMSSPGSSPRSMRSGRVFEARRVGRCSAQPAPRLSSRTARPRSRGCKGFARAGRPAKGVPHGVAELAM